MGQGGNGQARVSPLEVKMSYGKHNSQTSFQTRSIFGAGILAIMIGASMTACDRSVESVATEAPGASNHVSIERGFATSERSETQGSPAVALGGGGDFEAADLGSQKIVDSRDWESAPDSSNGLNQPASFKSSQPVNFGGNENNQFQANDSVPSSSLAKIESGGDFSNDVGDNNQQSESTGNWANQDSGSSTTKK